MPGSFVIRCPACGTDNLDASDACGVCSARLLPPSSRSVWSAVLAVPARKWRRAAYALAVVGAALVLATIPTNSRPIVLVGLIFAGLAHLILVLSYVRRRRA